MLYDIERWYFRQPDAIIPTVFPILRICTSVCAPLATHYKAVLVPPFKENIKKKISPKSSLVREGASPKSDVEKILFLEDLLSWIEDNAPWSTSFQLFLGHSPIQSHPEPTDVLLYYFEWSAWLLNLFPETFKTLQSELTAHAFPPDLFYPESAKICVPEQPKGAIGKFFQRLGSTRMRCFSPKEWENRGWT